MTPAGTEIFVGNLALELGRHGHEVNLVHEGKKSGSHRPLGAGNVVAHGLRLISIPYIRALDFRRKCSSYCAKLLSELDIEVVIGFGAGTFSGYIFERIKKLRKRPLLIYYAMDSMIMEYERSKASKKAKRLPTRFKRWMWYTALIKSDKASCFNSDLILASSKDTANHLIADYGIPSDKITVLYEGIPDDFTDGINVIEPGVPTFLHIAGDIRKGTDFFLKGMKLLKEKYGLRAKAIITRANLTHIKQTRELRIDAEIYGYVSNLELKHLYASCTCLVAPSLSEGFCLPIIEAAMFGKPAIVTRTGSLPELVNDGIDGYVTPVADVDSLAERMYELATNDELRRRMSIKAEEKAEKFKISVVAKNFIPIISMTNRP